MPRSGSVSGCYPDFRYSAPKWVILIGPLILSL